jgi:hypothetical protein
MTDASMPPVMLHNDGGGAGSGFAPGIAGWLGLAAAPTFALMALWSAASSGPPDVFCMQHGSPLAGMTAMYLLMSAFHAAPWLKLLAGRAIRS